MSGRQLSLLDEPDDDWRLDPHHIAIGKRAVLAARRALDRVRSPNPEAQPCSDTPNPTTSKN